MEIIDIIKEKAGVDVTIKNRKKEIVDLKILASTILRKQGLTYQSIADLLNVNHCTILHHIKIADYRIQQSKQASEILQYYENRDYIPELQSKESDKLLKKIKEQQATIEILRKDTLIKRIINLLEKEYFKEKLEAFVAINEKAKYYPKFK